MVDDRFLISRFGRSIRRHGVIVRAIVPFFLGLLPIGCSAATAHESVSVTRARRPNIVLILADDLGYGDLGCQQTGGRIATPHLDALAAEGLRFTDAHSPSSVCTPTRYALLTGRYAWRTRLQRGVLFGYDRPLIDDARETFADLLKRRGYATACLGKWHLGLDWLDHQGRMPARPVDPHAIAYDRPFAGGPLDAGFDRFFGIAASLDMPPYVWLERDRARDLPTTEKTWIRTGPAAADFEAIDVQPELTRLAVAWIDERAEAARQGKPFLLYLPLAAPHTPILPTSGWQGRSGLNPYADFTMQVDDCVGEITRALERQGLSDDTLVIFTSDNGCSPEADLPALAAAGHLPSGPFRGHKADIYEGGHRVPLIVRWPAVIAPGSRSDRTVGLIDLAATFAEIAEAPLDDRTAEDSFSLLPILRGDEATYARRSLVMHSIHGAFAIRRGDWKLALCPGSGGWSNPVPGKEPADASRRQLFDLRTDPSESHDLSDAFPGIAAELNDELERIVARGRSTPGPALANDVPVDPHQQERR